MTLREFLRLGIHSRERHHVKGNVMKNEQDKDKSNEEDELESERATN